MNTHGDVEGCALACPRTTELRGTGGGALCPGPREHSRRSEDTRVPDPEEEGHWGGGRTSPGLEAFLNPGTPGSRKPGVCGVA